ncbi:MULTISPECIES: methionine synthase II (cobalamin-independent)-like protein [unclassified Streptomyces]|uniref:methionine synthase II (cobalamin-independent)-like protein n=1 Tax=unclassified Streptomyces TaxID=2593676 RepID=UPI000DB9C261|nr:MULTISPECIES: methionine synthase II (cobalamin-independent)-like protein [unclassified Streptomyces]MYT74205.1 methionine synthase II (cobalamin-independent)-like protein [Streptomyces sp. SID8367]RAJ89623.1 5-methyltetrahydropteroyltriglutamate--homocysteine methyltransferase [Streptomyces sp. PsTaAH-137]
MADTFNYRIDHLGSLVRPAGLNRTDPDSLTAALTAAVAHQRKLRSTVVTDGGYPYEDFRGAVLENVAGVRRTDRTGPDGLAVWAADTLPEAEGPLAVDHARHLAGLTVIAPKVTLPAPSYLAATLESPLDVRELGEAFAEIVRAEIARLVDAGVRLVQLDNPLLLAGTAPGAAAAAFTGSLPYADALAIDAAAVRLDSRPEGVRIGCFPGATAPETVDRAAAERLFNHIPADRWILPLRTASAAELDLVRALPEDRDVCFGVVDAAVADLEDIDTVLDRLDAAGELKDLEDAAISPAQGFADIASRPLLTEPEQHAKLVLVETLARYVWGNEF